MQNAERSTRAAEQDGSGTVIDAALSFGPAKIYDLTGGQPNSDAFYSDVAEFVDRVLREAEFRGGPLLDEYSEYLRSATEEAARSRGEYAMELLTLGMTLRLYAKTAARTKEWAVSMAEVFLRLRRRSQFLKPAADIVRGAIFRFGFATPADCNEPELMGLDRLPRLLRWLEATGGFDEEAARLHHWHNYLLTAATHASSTCLENGISLFDWFGTEAAGALGSYNRGVRGSWEARIFAAASAKTASSAAASPWSITWE